MPRQVACRRGPRSQHRSSSPLLALYDRGKLKYMYRYIPNSSQDPGGKLINWFCHIYACQYHDDSKIAWQSNVTLASSDQPGATKRCISLYFRSSLSSCGISQWQPSWPGGRGCGLFRSQRLSPETSTDRHCHSSCKTCHFQLERAFKPLINWHKNTAFWLLHSAGLSCLSSQHSTIQTPD